MPISLSPFGSPLIARQYSLHGGYTLLCLPDTAREFTVYSEVQEHCFSVEELSRPRPVEMQTVITRLCLRPTLIIWPTWHETGKNMITRLKKDEEYYKVEEMR